MAVELNGKVWKKFVEFFRYEKGYEDWTEDEIEDSRNDDDTTEFIGWLVNELEANKVKEKKMFSQDPMEMTICDHYYNIVKGLADKVIKYDGIYDDEKYFQAIDDSLNKEDDAYIVANALEKGIISWGHNVDWDAVNEMLYSDIMEEIRKIKGE